MQLVSDGEFISDIDIIARLSDFPRSRDWLTRTWEVKVSLLCEDGSARSLKAGKTTRTINQLNAYRSFGSPEVSLLDTYVCEAGFMAKNAFPPPLVRASIEAKLPRLAEQGFGYQLLPFEHGKAGDEDVGLLAMPQGVNPLQTSIGILKAVPTPEGEGFGRLVDRIDEFFVEQPDRPSKSFHQVVFCMKCRQLQLVRMRDEHLCPTCGSDLIVQS